jgi:DNA-binding FrmR family transcriptional regulator
VTAVVSTVTVPLAEYDRLRRLETRLHGVVKMLTKDLELIKTGQIKASASATRYALSFAAGALEDHGW